MTARRAFALALAVVGLTAGCAGWPGASRGPGHHAVPPSSAGLGTETAFVTVVRRTAVRATTMRLSAREAAPVLEAVGRLLETVPTLAPQPGGARFLVNLRLNESAVDVSIWDPQTMVLAGRKLHDVSGIVIPLTGSWRGRVFLLQEGVVQVSPALADADLASVESALAATGAH